MVSLEVWDTGIGMTKSNTSQIFKEFHQLQNPKSDGRKGFGLGLAISQGLAKVIGSEITVGSTLDRGSVFRFRVPLSQSAVIDDAGESVNAALQYIARRQPDIMLVDYRLGDDQTGSQAINTIRTFFGVDIPAVIITGDSAKNRLSEVAGAVPAFMRKPASATKLRETISSLL